MAKKKAAKKTVRQYRRNKKKSTHAKKRHVLRSIVSFIWFWGVRVAVILFILILAYAVVLDAQIREKFEGNKWKLPAHVYTRPMEIYLGQPLSRDVLIDELEELGYQKSSVITKVGTYAETAFGVHVHQRAFQYWDGPQSQQKLNIQFANGQVSQIQADNQDTEIVRLEPRLFGSVSSLSHQDRSLVELSQVPKALIDALIAIEDRQYYSHFGINPMGIMRAMLRNIKAGRVVQGGSTLTQQLVKNYYLNSEITVSRKLKEMLMAILLELHYSKDEILQAYINEVHISQAGARAIHGFELGSRYFFGRPLQELNTVEIALLVGLINGPSYYHPIRNPKRALKRRNLVLESMLKIGAISQQEYQKSISSKLGISPNAQKAAPLTYPAFSGLVRDSLQNSYNAQDLSSQGLKIHTSLNPRIQKNLEKSVQAALQSIEKSRKIPLGTLQVATVVIRVDNGEVVGLMGGRKSGFSGFNRAVDAQRPVGSLLKPFVYLTALEHADEYSLASPISDTTITVQQKGSPDWTPENYNNKEHGEVLLIDALARSYNLATVRLGMQLGLERVRSRIRALGYNKPLNAYPSMLLGAVPMSVMDVSQMYLTLASDGFKTPIKSVRAVLDDKNAPLSRYPLQIEQVVAPEYAALTNYALQEVMRSGTGRNIHRQFARNLGLAGKTGTTNDYRDSWFAGFSGNYLVVVWVGRDDNKPTGLSGASGAAKVWAKIMQSLSNQPLQLPFGEQVVAQEVQYSQDPIQGDCSVKRQLPILIDSLPLDNLPCEQTEQSIENTDQFRHFEPQRKPSAEPRKKRSFWQRIFGE